ncbi:cadherin-like protein 26 isoform X2 [Echeneis naucrates]|uniref:cadherin-like protein 26 isoform X2 n=1 Tax=Echeneis naucrates TaxID=173247 RepID=UPI00111446EC|nr:cadherin-like protein 26 isoform X2 [Echeneis naucrates]
MRTVLLFVMFALAAVDECRSRLNPKSREKRELLERVKRRWVLSTLELTEEEPGPYPRRLSQMYNNKSNQVGKSHKFRISGMGVTEEPLGVFSIQEDTGIVIVHKPIDRERYSLFHIKFDILDRDTGEKIDKELAFDVEVKDINDNAPRFSHPEIQADVMENTAEGFLSVQLHVTDPDEENTPSSTFTLRVISQKPPEPKIYLRKIDDLLTQLRFEGCFNYDKIKRYEIIVEAKDHGTPSLSSTAVITLNVVDSNTHLPTFKETKYHGEVEESVLKDDILRIAVDDKDVPKTPGWRAKYFFIKGNEGGNYKIETDPETNEGILSVIKGKDFEKTTLTTLEIGVENEEPLFVCHAGSSGPAKAPPSNSINVTVKVIDINDPPHFLNEKNSIYMKEEEQPGMVLFTPNVHDVDSDTSKIRYKIANDPAGWATIDPKTGEVKSVKKMDRESPHVENGIYKLLVIAIDDGEPPATGTATVLIHLNDINDNKPYLVKKSVILCENKEKMVMLPVRDNDTHPYSGPFTFSLGGDDKILKQWKLEKSFGEEVGLVSLSKLYNGNFSVPLVIKDQQGVGGQETIHVIVCDCGKGDVCKSKMVSSVNLGPAAIGLIFAGLLLLLLLLLALVCKNGRPILPNHMVDDGNQTLIQYNQEGGGAACSATPTFLLTPTNGITLADGQHQNTMQISKTDETVALDEFPINSSATWMNANMTSIGGQYHKDLDWKYSSWNASMMSNGNSMRYQHTFSFDPHIEYYLERKLPMLAADVQPAYQPYEYGYEGKGSYCQSLDELSLSHLGDDLEFLDDLGPKFKNLGGICDQKVQEMNMF